MMNIAHIALTGLHRAETRLAKSAQEIVESTTIGFSAASGLAEQNRGYDAYSATNSRSTGVDTLSGFLNRELTTPPPRENLAASFVDMRMAAVSYKASLAVFKTADELQEATIEILT